MHFGKFEIHDVFLRVTVQHFLAMMLEDYPLLYASMLFCIVTDFLLPWKTVRFYQNPSNVVLACGADIVLL